MILLKKSSTEQPLCFLLISSTDHITGLTGASPTVTLSKNGGAFGAAGGAVSEIGNGWYQVAASATDTGSLGPLLLHAAATGADPVDKEFEVVAFDPQSATNLGLSGIGTAQTGDAFGYLTANPPATAGAKMDLVNSPNSAAIAAIQSGLATPGAKMDLVDAPNATALSGVAAAVWNALASGLSAAGSIGQRILAFFGDNNYAPALANPSYPIATDSLGRVTVANGSLGTGSVAWPVTIELASGDPLGNASVWITSDAEGNNIVAGPAMTDSNGCLIFDLDPGVYYRWATAAGCAFDNPQTFTVATS